MSAIESHHREWLNLIEVEGPFLALPVLTDAFPNGLEDPDDTSETAKLLRAGLEEWELGLESGDSPTVHEDWIWFVLRQVLGYDEEVLREKGDLADDLAVSVPEQGEVLTPDFAVVEPKGADSEGQPRLLAMVVGPDQALDRPMTGKRWKATPEERMADLLRGAGKSGVPLGLLTNGTRWSLVHAPRGETVGKGSWDATIWLEERITLRAFRTLLGIRRFFLTPDQRLEALFEKSGEKQQTVTDELGRQIRRALEVIVQKIDELDRSSARALLEGVEPKTLYESSVTIMMRLVFLFYAEEQQLLPVDEPVYARDYSASNLLDQLQEESDRRGPQILERRYSAWSRLLAIFRAVHGGIEHEALRLPAYGGSLFDPDRFPFLENRPAGTSWKTTPARPLEIDDRTVLQILSLLQFLGDKGVDGGGVEALRLSFKGLGVEQIGHVYEGLLDHTAVRANEPVLSLWGKKGLEPEIPISQLEEERAKGEDHFAAWVKDETKLSAKRVEKAFAYEFDSGDGRWLVACDNDSEVLDRISRYAGLVRDDPSGRPVVIPEGSIYVTQGSDRRSIGAHYTPPSLTEPIAKHTLEPLVYEGPAEGKPEDEWKLRPPRELLALRVCDLAMGSGAFLVAACRYLAERLVEAWEECEQAQPGKILVSPEGDLSAGDPREALVPADPAERLAAARRFVVDRCLYGVDKDPMAVEMGKLSLWLVTLQKGKPFSFLDHALKNGDSLLGVSRREQLEAFDLSSDGKGQLDLFGKLVGEAMTTARKKRERLEAMAVNDVRDAEEKARLLAEADAALGVVRQAGDLLTAAALSTAGESDSAYESRRGTLAEAFGKAIDSGGDEAPCRERLAGLERQARRLLDEGKPLSERAREPFHWPIEFPEVFENGGFDAIVGNPPFQGGQKITGALGTNFRNYLVEWLAGGAKGSADLVAYMFLRASELLRPEGSFGLIATNTIAQGDTREVGLDRLLEAGCSVPRAVASQNWPGQANLEVAIIWFRKGPWAGAFALDGDIVKGITSQLLVPGRVSGKPYRLLANEDKSFIGSYVLGMGFVLEPNEAERLIQKDPKNRDVLFPYLNGQDLNSRPDQSPSRWVLNFHDWPLERAEEYADCISILREKVKPERETNNRKVYRDYWWHYAEKRPKLYSTIEGMERVLARARVSNINSIAFVPAGTVMSEATVVFASDCLGFFALLQSFAHTAWLERNASSMRTDVRYTPSDCFETFPFSCSQEDLVEIGDEYYGHRGEVMASRGEGLTKTYNRFHDSGEVSEDIARLRDLHVEMDQAVAAAYGWGDLDLGHDFHETDQVARYALSPPARREVLDRLLELNHQRYAEEVAQGLHDKRSKATKKKVTRNEKPVAIEQPGLFDAPAQKMSSEPESSDYLSAIVHALESSSQPLSKSELLAASGITTEAWGVAIRDALRSGKVSKQGERRGTRYLLAARNKK